MSVFMDLNILAITDKKKLQSTIETAAHLGYSTVAINYVVEPQQKKQQIPKPESVTELFEKFPIVQEKLFHAACMTYDVDIICIAVTEKQPFHCKRSPVNGAIERGVSFEISYTAAIRDSTMKKYTIANAINLTEVCKGKNVILTSGAEVPIELRGPYDIANLGLVFGLSEGDAKAAVSTNCRAVVLHGETRATALGIIHTMKRMQPTGQEQEEESPAAKKAKVVKV
ncbi:ribonuclease P protein subunit p30 isoform X3 [Electrophorus electricus]|uniref:ribonuclease P protein subunit p30 isoform X3 n=1 Tax=Electrophorus electricus TaxID=8005 RepID=UPI0015CFE861|nr:ribonuclease P protein subunit p30 isoform X3 [Electrophorus electricus]